MDLQAHQSKYVSASCVAEFTAGQIWVMHHKKVTNVYQDTVQFNGETYTWKFEFVPNKVKDYGGALDCNVSLVEGNSKLLPIHPLVVVRKIFRNNQGIELRETYRSLKRKPVSVGDTFQFPNVYLERYDKDLALSGKSFNVIEFTVLVHYEDKTRFVEVLPSRLVLPMNSEQQSSEGENAGSQVSSCQTEHTSGSYNTSNNAECSLPRNSAPASSEAHWNFRKGGRPKKPRADESNYPPQMQHPGLYSAILHYRPEMQHPVSTSTRSNGFPQYSTTEYQNVSSFHHQVYGEANHSSALNAQNLDLSRNAYSSSNHSVNPNGSNWTAIFESGRVILRNFPHDTLYKN